jgi:hypothetical protein
MSFQPRESLGRQSQWWGEAGVWQGFKDWIPRMLSLVADVHEGFKDWIPEFDGQC